MDLATDYMGLALRNPLVASASPALADRRRRAPPRRRRRRRRRAPLALRRAAAPRRRRATRARRRRNRELRRVADLLPERVSEDPGPRRYLSLLERAAAAVDIPVIASLNGVTPGGWTDYARRCRRPAPPRSSSTSTTSPATRTSRSRRRAAPPRRPDRVKDARHRPVAVKLGPYFSSTGEMALRARRGRRRRARAVQPLPPARHRPRDAAVVPGSGSRAQRRRGCSGPGSPSYTGESRALAGSDDRRRGAGRRRPYLLAGRTS